jgi:predicted nuclease of predicted toxin-antitoxin system
VSPRIARALRELSFNVEHVGGDGQPAKGSEDSVVLEAAKRRNQVVVTTNHDMIVLCLEEGESVVWLDPRDKNLTLVSQTEMCFSQIAEWELQLGLANGPVCVVARKTRTEVMAPDRAKRIALERGKRRRRKARPKPPRALGELLGPKEAG